MFSGRVTPGAESGDASGAFVALVAGPRRGVFVDVFVDPAHHGAVESGDRLRLHGGHAREAEADGGSDFAALVPARESWRRGALFGGGDDEGDFGFVGVANVLVDGHLQRG